MKDENEVQRPDQVTPHVAVASSESGMDLSDLWNMLVRWKVTVLGVAFVTFVVIVANAFLNTPVPLYKARAILLLPSENDIEGIQGYTPPKAFRAFVRNLKSRAVRLRYFKENKLLDKLVPGQDSDAKEVFEEKFNRMLSVISQGDHADVSFEGANARLAAEWVNGFVTLANKETVRALVQPQISRLNNRKSTVESKMNALRMSIADRRKVAKRKREDRIIRLEEMALIAERIGIKNVISCRRIMPLYMRGARALRAEASVLRERKSDDPFNSKIRDLQSQLTHMQSEFPESKLAPSDFSHVSATRVMQMATVPDRPINKPVFKWVMLTGVLSGLVLGVLAAFFADFIVRAREKEAVQSRQGLVE